MKKLISGFAFVVALSLSNASAAISIKDARENYEAGGDRKEMLLFYLASQENGLSWANVELEMAQREPLYCPPDKLNLNGENVYSLTNDYVTKNSANPEAPFDMYVMRALYDAFPCA